MRILIRLALLAAVCSLIAIAWTQRPNLPAAERGRRLAEHEGCFACHGPGGIRGTPNLGRADRTVPTFEGDVMMYAHDDEDLRQWIRDGVSKRKSVSQSWRAERDRGALRMPAFRKFSRRQLDDLVAFVAASGGSPEPGDSLAAAGLVRAEKLGCTGCHGPGGRLAGRNPGSFKGYVPAWDSRDFAELVRSRAEFHQWVHDGVSDRFHANALAMLFLNRAAVHMPAFGDRVSEADEEAIWVYVRWLRATPH